MLGDLSTDLIGTDPKYPKIVNHGWLDVHPATYDNYPSDNNSVRIQPKLSELWNHQTQPVTIIPNATVQPLGIRSADQIAKEDNAGREAVIREAKKAMMAGLEGKALADHIRSRFSTKHIELASDELKKLASEVGLMGNVYVDASAFTTYEEASKFMGQHRNRLSQDILFDADKMNASVVERLASEFKKRIVSEVKYDEKTLAKYKDHLVAIGKIPANFEVTSKEDLRAAFLYRAPSLEQQPVSAEEKRLADTQVVEGLETLAQESTLKNFIAREEIRLRQVYPVLAVAQQAYANGKDPEGIKEILRKKFSSTDLKEAASFLKIIASAGGLTQQYVKDTLANDTSLSENAIEILMKLAKTYPVKTSEWVDSPKADKPVGVPGYFYALRGKNSSHSKAVEKSVEAMRKGMDQDSVHKKLLQANFTAEEADKILTEATMQFNTIPAGVVANKVIKPAKERLVEDPVTKPTLPSESTIIPQMKEMLDFYKDANTDIDVGTHKKTDTIEINETFNREGLDLAL